MLLENIALGVAVAILCYVVLSVAVDIFNNVWR